MQNFLLFFFIHIFYFSFFSDSSIGADMQARPEVQERAIIVALLMFGIIVERFIEVLKESLNGGSKTSGVVILSGEEQRKVDKT